MQDLLETKIPCILPLAAKDVKDLRQNPGYSNVDIFTYEEMRLATNQFRPDYILGEGGFEAVYKGVIDETARPGYKSTAVVIKELNPDGFQGDREWLVFKGKKMSGRMGAKTRSVKNVWVYKIDPARNLMWVRGQVPGAKGNFVFIKDSVYKKPDVSMLPFPTYFAAEDEDETNIGPLVADPWRGRSIYGSRLTLGGV